MFKLWNIKKANDEIKNLSMVIEDLKNHNEQLTKEVGSLKQIQATYSLGSQDWSQEKEALIAKSTEAMNAINLQHQESYKNMELKYANQISELVKTVTEEKESASIKAANLVTSIGLEPETVVVTKHDLVNSRNLKNGNRFKFTVRN